MPSGIREACRSESISSQEKSHYEVIFGRFTSTRPLGLAATDWIVLGFGLLFVAILLLLIPGV